MVDVVECRPIALGSVASTIGALPGELRIFVELPLLDDPRELACWRSAAAGAWAKIRTGGVTADAFPSAREVGRFLARAAELIVPFKATAGLHHPVCGDVSAHVRRSVAASAHVRLPQRLRGRRVRAGAHARAPARGARRRGARRDAIQLRRTMSVVLARPHGDDHADRARARVARARVRLVLVRRAGRRPARARAPVTPRIDETHRPELRSWVESANAPATDFPDPEPRRSASSARADGASAPRRRDRRPDPGSDAPRRSRSCSTRANPTARRRVRRARRAQSAARGGAGADARAARGA